MARKPANLLYGVDDTPSPSVVLVLGLQHFVAASGASVFAVAIVRGIGGTTEQAELLVQVSLLVAGIGTILQALRTGPVGSGYLCPHVCGPSYLPASLLAAKTGGLSLMLGMTVLAGCFEALFSRVLPRLRAIFPPEMVGLVVMVVGLSLLPIAVSGFVGITATDPVSEVREILVAGLTLGVMVGLSVWGTGRLAALWCAHRAERRILRCLYGWRADCSRCAILAPGSCARRSQGRDAGLVL